MAHADKYPGLCTPDESYHGITYAEKFGKEGAFITKCTAQLMRDFGSINKWSVNSLPDEYVLTDRLEKLPLATFTHTHISRLASNRFVRENTDPNLTLTLHISCYGTVSSGPADEGDCRPHTGRRSCQR